MFKIVWVLLMKEEQDLKLRLIKQQPVAGSWCMLAYTGNEKSLKYLYFRL